MTDAIESVADAAATPTPAPSATSLTARLRELAILRAAIAERDSKIKQAMADYRDKHLADDMRTIEATKRAADVLENEIKAVAVLTFSSLTPEQKAAKDAKKLVPGIGIQETQDYEITDRAAAFAWSKASGIGYQPESFVEKDVLDAAKKLKTPLPFVKCSEGYKATIASDLLKVFPEVAP